MQAQSRPSALLAVPLLWKEYFPVEDCRPGEDRVKLIKDLEAYFRTAHAERVLKSIKPTGEGKYSVSIHCDELVQASGCELLYSALSHQPAEGLGCIGIALGEVIFSRNAPTLQQLGSNPKAGRIRVLLHSCKASTTHINQLHSLSVGKFVTVQGTVVRLGHTRPLCLGMEFQCDRCRSVTFCAFPDGIFQYPSKCNGDGCRAKSFKYNTDTARAVNWQRVQVQEMTGGKQLQKGTVPKTVDVDLKEDLVGCCQAGDIVTITGIVKTEEVNGGAGAGAGGRGGRGRGRGRQQQQQQPSRERLFSIYIDAVSVTTHEKGIETSHEEEELEENRNMLLEGDGLMGTGGEGDGTLPGTEPFTEKDYEDIRALFEGYPEKVLHLMVASLCPHILGQELVKAGLLLALVGGVRKNIGSTEKVPIRGDIHVMLVGDPGLGKSKLLQAVTAVAPRGLYVCGNTSTNAGLTVSVVRDQGTGDFMFEAGALVLADQGVCCVDEFDKMPAEHAILLEAMEQQEVSVAKAGLVASLPARTTVIAAANPVEGHYNMGKTLQENLKMSPAMMSRFDLLFVLRDLSDQHRDAVLSAHVAASWSTGGTGFRPQAAASSVEPFSQIPTQGGSGEVSLKARLKSFRGERHPPELLRKYIAYMRQYIKPVLSREAADQLQKFYLELRQQGSAEGSAPITARQLESLVRLAEARAKVEFRERVTKQDALDVIEIMKATMVDLDGFDAYKVAALAMSGGSGARRGGARGGRGNKATEQLQRIAESLKRNYKSGIFTTHDVGEMAKALGTDEMDAKTLAETLNAQGFILAKGGGTWKAA